LFNTLPQIGHAEVGFFPDMAFYRWKYTHKASGQVYERDNTQMFLDAAKCIYERLIPIEKEQPDAVIPWAALESQIRRLLSRAVKKARVVDRFTLPAYRLYVAMDVQKRCEMWQRTFGSLFGASSANYAYDKNAWRDQAIEGNTNWDNYSQAEWAQMMPRIPKPDFWNSLWVHFHRAALRHRHIVLENLP
jgi:hypothetical protein